MHDGDGVRAPAVQGAVDDKAGAVDAEDVAHNAGVDDVALLVDGQEAGGGRLSVCNTGLLTMTGRLACKRSSFLDLHAVHLKHGGRRCAQLRPKALIRK